MFRCWHFIVRYNIFSPSSPPPLSPPPWTKVTVLRRSIQFSKKWKTKPKPKKKNMKNPRKIFEFALFFYRYNVSRNCKTDEMCVCVTPGQKKKERERKWDKKRNNSILPTNKSNQIALLKHTQTQTAQDSSKKEKERDFSTCYSFLILMYSIKLSLISLHPHERRSKHQTIPIIHNCACLRELCVCVLLIYLLHGDSLELCKANCPKNKWQIIGILSRVYEMEYTFPIRRPWKSIAFVFILDRFLKKDRFSHKIQTNTHPFICLEW